MTPRSSEMPGNGGKLHRQRDAAAQKNCAKKEGRTHWAFWRPIALVQRPTLTSLVRPLALCCSVSEQ